MNVDHRPWCWLVLSLLAPGCASSGEPPSEPLPFHVAVMPVVVEPAQLPTPVDKGSATDATLTFAGGDPSREILAALEGTFTRVTMLSPAREGQPADVNRDAWFREARDKGADMVLDSTLSYQETVHTSLNDRFWLNLPLHAIGGPFGWFVNDRSYYFNVRLQAELIDVLAALSEKHRDADRQVLPFDRQVREASLDFLDRADDVGAYALGMLLPAGFVARSSGEVAPELEQAISVELSDLFARSLRERRNEVLRGKLVAFYPHEVGVSTSAGVPHLEGEFVLEIAGGVEELGEARYRFGDEPEYHPLDWGEPTLQPAEGRGHPLRRYGFRIPLPADGNAETIQLEVSQRDALPSRRTYTYAIPRPAPRSASGGAGAAAP